MVKTSSITEPYFSHDYSTQSKKEIKKLIRDFGFEGYGLYWAIVEFMYRNELMVGEEDLVVDSLHKDKITAILNNYQLFHIEDEYYISDRIIETIEKQEERGKQAKDAATTRWLLSAFSKEYEKVFGIKPLLDDKEIQTLKDLNSKIDDLKSKFSSIFKVLKKIKFNGDFFIPGCNWLLQKNHLREILNGQYGKLDIPLPEVNEAIKNQEIEREQAYQNITSKEDAIAYAVKYASYGALNDLDSGKAFMAKWEFTLEEFLNAGGKRSC